MIGFQILYKEKKITAKEIEQELGIKRENVYQWNYEDKVPDKYLNYLSNKLNVDKEYLNKQVNDIKYSKPRKKGFNNYKISGNTTIIFIERKNGDIYECLIDTEDLERVSKYRYHMHYHKECKNACYVSATIYNKDKKKSEVRLLHSIVLDVDSNTLIDHRDNNPLNNTKDNLRIIPKQANTKNRNGKNKNNKSGYRNVSVIDGKYVVQISINGKNTRLGEYTDVHEAGREAEKARQKYYGEFAGRNDPIEAS